MLTAIVFMLVVVHGHVLEQLSLTFLILLLYTHSKLHVYVFVLPNI